MTHLSELNAAKTRPQFEAVYEKIKALSSNQVIRLASGYAGGPKAKSKSQALNTIRSKFTSEMLFKSKTTGASNMKNTKTAPDIRSKIEATYKAKGTKPKKKVAKTKKPTKKA